MAVDANVLIFERMKEELRAGRALADAIEIGWKRAWPSIRDSNIASLIICSVLYYFGSNGASVIQGFATTLALGVAISMFTAIVVTRTFLTLLLATGKGQHPHLFGMAANNSDAVKTWRNKRQNEERILIALKDFSYIVILADRGDFVLLWTAYPVEYRHSRQKLRQEYEEYVKKKG